MIGHVIFCKLASDWLKSTYLQINLIAPPLYVMTTRTLEKSDGLKVMQTALEKIQEVITEAGGVFTIKMAVSTGIAL